MAYVEKVVVLVDMDCFYCQVEENLNPSLKGKPLAVVQYNAWKGGGIIAVNYPAREKGVTRHMRGDEAKQKCPEIELVSVPNVREKADLTKYREAGKLVAKVLQKFTPLLERASVDEAYLDITAAVKDRMEGTIKEVNLNDIKNTYIASGDVMDFLYNLYNSGLCLESNLRLAYGAAIVEEIRLAVFKETGYTCSAGIAHNKILAKLACGLHKPNKQTILPQENVPLVYKDLPVHKIRSLGGKFGETLSEDLGITNMSELIKFSEKELTKYYDEKMANWLYNIARGINLDPVTTRLLSKSIACCKKFPGKSALIERESVEHWLNELALEIVERLEKDFEENNRKAKQIVVSFSQEVRYQDVASSRTLPLPYYDVNKIVKDANEVIIKNCLKPTGNYCIKFLGLSAGKFEDCKNVNEITSFFKILPVHNKSDDDNNYSDSTVDLQEDENDLIFLKENDYCDLQNNTSDSDSIDNEIFNATSKISNETKEETPSFFLNYIGTLKPSPAKRDFNTAKIFEGLSDDDSMDKNSVGESSTSYDIVEPDKESTICKYCKKKIVNTELVSHMDYHFALQMIKDESALYKVAKPTPIQNNEARKSTKRKFSEVDKNSLIKFLTPNIKALSTETATELCPHCNRQIESGVTFLSHLDYHIARKLHMDINPVKSSNKTANAIHSKTKQESRKHVKQTKNVKSITTFFKPTI